MAWEECIESIRAAAGRELTDDDVAGLLEDVQRRAERLRRDRVDLSAAELAREAARELSAEAEMAAKIEARNRKQNLLKRVARRSFYEKAPTLQLGLEAKLVGVNTPFEDSRRSVDAQGRALERDYKVGLTVDLERAGLFQFVRDGQHDREIARELFELTHPDGQPGRTGNRQAAEAAAIIHRYQEAARVGLNKAGAWIGQYDGWIARTAHDADRIRQAGFEEWKQAVLDTVDHDRTFDGVEDVDLFLRRVFNGLQTGIHLTTEGMQGFKDPAFTGPGNLAKRLSRGRVLHFRDADAWMAYQERFGGRRLIENVLGGLTHAARNTALMREFGTNPRAEFEGDLTFLKETMRDRDPAAALSVAWSEHKLRTQFDELDGTAMMPVNRMLARIGTFTRLWETTSKLGGALLSAVTDVPLKAAELRYQGVGLLEGYADGVASLTRGRGRGEVREVLDLLRAGSDGMLGGIAERFDPGADTPTGTMSKLANLFFRWNGLQWWTDSQRAGAEMVMSRHLGRLVRTPFADLPDDTTRLLRAFGIGEPEWSALGTVDLAQVDGRAHLTPDRALRLSDETVDAMIPGRLADARAAAVDRLARDVEGLERLENRLGRLGDVVRRRVPDGDDVDAIDVRATVDIYRRQAQAIEKTMDRILALRDGEASPNRALKTMRREIDGLAKAERRIAGEAALKMERLAARIPKAEARHAEALAAIERVKDEMVRRIEAIETAADRLDDQIAGLRDEARQDLALKLHSYFSDRGEFAVINPGARERAIMRQGTRPGTPVGEALRWIGQFKAFPVAVISKAWGREIHGGHPARAAGIAHMMVATTVFGYLAATLKDLSKGRNPRDPTDPRTWGAAFMQGGSLGIFGDFLMADYSRYNRTFTATAVGPFFGTLDELAEIWSRAIRGNDLAAQALRTASYHTPFINMFYTRAALDYLFLHQVQEALNPGYLRRFEQRVERENAQTFWLRPTEVAGR